MQDSQNSKAKPIKSLNIFGQPMMIFGVPVDQKTIFSNYKGVYKKRIEKRQRKLIVKTAFIKFFLQPEERINCLTSGYSPITVLEQVLTGLAFLFFKRAIFVFTERRLLHIPVRYGTKSLRSISQILFDDCAQIALKGRALVVQLKNGHQEVFPYIGRREKKKVIALLDSIPFQPDMAGPSKSRRYLCPSCANLLVDKVPACPTCQLKFKSKLYATLGAIAVPGGGYFYSRYPLFGVIIAIIELMLIGFMALHWIDFSKGLPVNYIVLALATAGFILEKAMVIYHAQQLVRDFLPAKNDFAVQKITPTAKNPQKSTQS